MNYRRVIALLREAETELTKIIEREIRKGRYDHARDAFEYAQTIGSLAESMRSERQESEHMRAVLGLTQQRFPRFFINGDRLVKLGASSGSEPYRHEMPARHFQILTDYIVGQRNEVWQMSTLVEFLSVHRIPSYQAYLGVAALREAGFLEPVRKGSYRLHPEAPPVSLWWSDMEQMWPNEDSGEVDAFEMPE